MKTNLDYYSRRTDAYRHAKFKTLRISYGGGTDGWAAEGRFWALNDIIAESEMCQIDLSKTRNKAMIADVLGMSFPDLEAFIKILISEDVELLFEIEPGIFSTKKVQETLASVLAEREKARDRWSKGTKNKSSSENSDTSDEGLKTSPEVEHKVKESKVKESKVNESKSKVEVPSSEVLGEAPLSQAKTFTLTPFNFTSFTPTDYENNEELKQKLIEMFSQLTGLIISDKSTIARFFNIITSTPQCTRKTAFRITFEALSEYNQLEFSKKNFRYLGKMIEGRIRDAIVIAREKRAQQSKHAELKQTEEFMRTPTNPEVASILSQFTQKLTAT